jgi:3-phosphoshikimate 1-carboxyvinyltransferase
MTNITVKRSDNLGGEVVAPPSKAYTHRILLAALLTDGVTEISDPLVSGDTCTTLKAAKAFGAKADIEEKSWRVTGTPFPVTPSKPVHCGDSGTTARFMIPIASLLPKSTTFIFGSSLKSRPMRPLLMGLKQLGADFEFRSCSQVTILGGGLEGGSVSVRGDISSQFISGLLFSAPLAKRDIEIIVTTPLESRSYVQMTIEVVKKHGVEIQESSNPRGFYVSSPQAYKPHNHVVPGDFSSASFLLAAATITFSKVRISNLNCNPAQGDGEILEILKRMGASVRNSDGYVEVSSRRLESINLDAKNIPDLVPVCTALACYSKGKTRIYNVRRLRYKESDRLVSLQGEFRKMGADITVSNEELIIRGPCTLHGTNINPHNDHRIAMACAIAALGASGETNIQDSECVGKSYPRFFDDLKALGADID